jgi:uncharacterized membrane-anchored protein
LVLFSKKNFFLRLPKHFLRRGTPSQNYNAIPLGTVRRLGQETAMPHDAMKPLRPLYWPTLLASSLLGTSLGDFYAKTIGLGHASGIVPMALMFFLLRRLAPAGTAAYWAAVVLLRVMATNFADLLTHDLHVPFGLTAAVLALSLAQAVLAGRPAARDGLPRINSLYWATMFLAGLLGTAGGDGLADTIGLPQSASLLGALFIAALALRARAGWATTLTYWCAIACARGAGTNGADWLADQTTLVTATALNTCLMLGLIVALAIKRPFALIKEQI